MVFGEGDVTDPVQSVLDAPVPADQRGKPVGTDVAAGEVVDDLGVPLAAGQRPAAAGDLDRESGVREPDPGGDRDQFDRAGLRPVVALAAGQVPRGDLGPGQRGELAVQARLVAFDGVQVVRATPR